MLPMAMSVVVLAAEGAETMHELPMPAYLYGVIALVIFALLLAVTWAFRGTAAKLGNPNHGKPGADHAAGSGHH